ncbi:MAG TPA: MFS transporter [Inquilinus sp.]|nr:MFS transporter [Inquilinus sp.]
MSAPSPHYRSVRQNPWWIPPFLGGVPQGVGPAHLRVLGFVTLAMFFENYDLCMLGHSLPQIAEAFGLDDVELGWFTTWTRLGALPAFFLLPLADRIGRRRLLLVAIAGMSVGSLATALAQSPLQFMVAQIATRSFIIAAAVTSFVVVSEEFPAANRGWGIGILGGVGAIGFGMGTLLYGFVESLPFGWRALYAVGLVPILFLPALARGLRETARFAATQVEGHRRSTIGGALRPIAELLRRHPRRALAIALIGAFSNAGIGPSFQFISQFLQGERDWTPGIFAAFSLVFGAVAIVGNPIAGRLSDRYGRRVVAAVVLALFPVVTMAFYLGPPSLVALPWTLMVLLAMASSVCVRALATEIFPTAYRGTGAGTLALLETVGVSAGLLAYTVLISALGSQAAAISFVAFACLGAAASVFLVPETARRELEDVATDPA